MKGLTQLSHETVIDRKMIALDEEGKPSFNVLRNYGSLTAPVLYFVFDVMCWPGRDVSRNRFRRGVISPANGVPEVAEPVRYAAPLDAEVSVLAESVKAEWLEGLVRSGWTVGTSGRRGRVPGRKCGSTVGRSLWSAATG